MSLNEEVLTLLDGVKSGRLTVKGYTSEWMKRPKNCRKMTIIVEDKEAVA